MKENLLAYLADDHEIVAAGLATLIKGIDGIREVQIFDSGKRLFNACFEKKPELVFLDYAMPEWDGQKTLIALGQQFPSIQVIMLTMNNEKKIIEDCISHGARAFLNKNSSVQELEAAINAVLNGQIYYSREALLSISGVNEAPKKQDVFDVQLSVREMEVLKLLCDGFSPKEIAQQLFLSPRTTETHKKNIMEKLGVNSVAKLVSVALRSKIIID